MSLDEDLVSFGLVGLGTKTSPMGGALGGIRLRENTMKLVL